MRVITLCDRSSQLSAQFVPGAGMIGTSLADGEVELLGQRRGLQAYLDAGKTMGIPLLAPWANRLGSDTYTASGRTVTLGRDAPGVRLDPNGLPIHGLLAANPDWQVVDKSEDTAAVELDFGAQRQLLPSFPFPHNIALSISVVESVLRIETTVTATADVAVPLTFGFHPYLHLPGVPRSDWLVETPALRHLEVDDRGLPTGAASSQPAASQTLGNKAFDDGYDEVADGSVFAVSGGGRRLEVHFETGYPAAQIFAPPAEDLICFEPMAAPTDALVRGGYRSAVPGAPARAVFAIRVA